jgi:flavin reductase (DIM6/NTAB) family NADH-FMN oxidoreductase RutF
VSKDLTKEKAFNSLVTGLGYPMFIVTAAIEDDRSGCLVGFASQVSIEPQRLLVCISKANRTYEVAREADNLVVHFLSSENGDLASLFGEETGDEVDKFAQCDWTEEADGAVVLNGTRGWVKGRVVERIDVGDHVAHLLDLADAVIDTEGDPLTFDAVRHFTPGHPA